MEHQIKPEEAMLPEGWLMQSLYVLELSSQNLGDEQKRNTPKELAMTNKAMRTAVFSRERPTSSNHMGANAKADQGNEPVTP